MSEEIKLPKLNFPPLKLRGRRVGNEAQIWDAVRGRWLVLTPEEWVRQHLIHCLVVEYGVDPHAVVCEYPVALNGQAQRADVVVVDRQGQPLLVAECKAPEIQISQATFDQAARYNSVLQAQYLILTNGLTHYCFRYADRAYQQMEGFPQLSAL